MAPNTLAYALSLGVGPPLPLPSPLPQGISFIDNIKHQRRRRRRRRSLRETDPDKRAMVHERLSTSLLRRLASDSSTAPLRSLSSDALLPPGNFNPTSGTFEISPADFVPLSVKSQYATWASRVKARLADVGIVEDGLHRLQFVDQRPDQPRGYNLPLSWERQTLAARIVVESTHPRLFQAGDLPRHLEFETDPWRLWDAIYAWAGASTPAGCMACWNLRKIVYNPRNGCVVQSRPAREFHVQAISGCATCQMIMGAVNAYVPGFSSRLHGKRIAVCGIPLDQNMVAISVTDTTTTKWARSAFTLQIYSKRKTRKFPSSGLGFLTASPSDGPTVPGFLQEPELDPNDGFGPPPGLTWAAEMMRGCKCPAEIPPFTPRSLLRVPSRDGDVQIVRNPRVPVKYCALSYCKPSDSSLLLPQLKDSGAVRQSDLPKVLEHPSPIGGLPMLTSVRWCQTPSSSANVLVYLISGWTRYARMGQLQARRAQRATDR